MVAAISRDHEEKKARSTDIMWTGRGGKWSGLRDLNGTSSEEDQDEVCTSAPGGAPVDTNGGAPAASSFQPHESSDEEVQCDVEWYQVPWVPGSEGPRAPSGAQSARFDDGEADADDDESDDEQEKEDCEDVAAASAQSLPLALSKATRCLPSARRAEYGSGTDAGASASSSASSIASSSGTGVVARARLVTEVDGLALHLSSTAQFGYKGVCCKGSSQKHRKKYRASVWDSEARKMKRIGGTYRTPLEAAIAFAKHCQSAATGRGC